MAENNWDNKTKVQGFTKCGTKEYSRKYIKQCTRELVVRAYLEMMNASQCITTLEKIEPQKLYEYIKENTSAEEIRNDFFNICEKVEQYIIREKITFPVRLTIEKGKEFECNTDNAEDTISEIFSALKALHSIGVVHVDIKPQNLLFAERLGKETIVLNDFDNSIILPGGVESVSINKPGQIRITPRFAAPEQYESLKNIGFATDIFSGAVVAYMLLNDNKHPYAETNDENKIKKIFNKWTPPKPCKNGSRSLKDIISRAMSIELTDRPSADEILKVLSDKSNPELEISAPAPEKKPEKEDKPVEENKQSFDNKGGINVNGDGSQNTINNYYPQSEQTTPQQPEQNSHSIVILALVIVAVIAAIVILAIVKGSADIHIDNENSAYINYSISSEPEVLTDTASLTSLTNLTTTDTTSAFSSAETEKKKILLQL